MQNRTPTSTMAMGFISYTLSFYVSFLLMGGKKKKFPLPKLNEGENRDNFQYFLKFFKMMYVNVKHRVYEVFQTEMVCPTLPKI